MGWLFDSCQDQYGACIRQYIVFSLSLIVSILGFYSTIKTYKVEKKVTFVLLPLLINTAASLCICVLYTQQEMYSWHLILLVIEIYSYFILAFGFVYLFMQRNGQYAQKLKYLNSTFMVFSGIVLLSILTLIILSIQDIIKCKEEQGIGSIIILFLEIPIYIITFIFTNRSRAALNQTIDTRTHQNLNRLKSQEKPDQSEQQTQRSHSVYSHLLKEEDRYLKLKLLQINLVVLSFSANILFHFLSLSLYQLADDQMLCQNGGNTISASNGIQLAILAIENISELFPHFTIPFIFWYLPARMNNSQKTLYMNGSADYVQSGEQNNIRNLKSEVDEEIRVRQAFSPDQRGRRISKKSSDSEKLVAY